MRGKLPLGIRVRWITLPDKFLGTIISYEKEHSMFDYWIQWDNGKLGKHSDKDLLPVIEPNNIIKDIL